jgi:hypothetical protein
VIDDGEGTPFEKGPNAIVISTSLFGNTKLHSLLEKEQLEQTPLWSPISGDYQFIAVDRDENSNNDGATNQVDFVIIRRAISSAQTMQVLDLLLTCYVNESVDELTNMTIYEEAELYTYVSTKLNGTNAETLNFHTDVLDYIPYFCDYQNNPQGQEPNSKNDLSAEYILTVTGYVALIVGAVVLAIVSWGTCTMLSIALICFAVMMLFMLDAYLPGIADILNNLQAFIVNLGMTVLTWLGPLGWTILRVALLVLIWKEFAFTLAIIAIGFSAILSLVLLLSNLLNLEATYNNTLIKLQKEEISTDIGYKTKMIYCSFLESEIPSVCIFLSKGSALFEIPFNNMGIGKSLTFPELKEDDDFFNKAWETNETLSISIEEYLTPLLAGMGAMMALSGSIMGILGSVCNQDKTEYDKAKIIASCGLAGFGLYLFINAIINNGFDLFLSVGMGLGFLIAFSFAFAAMFSNKREFSSLWQEILY